MKAETIKKIAASGFDVYMRDESDTFGYFTDGSNIGYFQEQPLEGLTLSTVHIPNRTSGTGFRLDAPETISAASLAKAFAHSPEWADSRARASVRKYRNVADFLAYDNWHKTFRLVAKGS